MNFCTKCASYYQTPGTCNCFAPPKVEVAPYVPNPWPNVPSPWIQPTTTPIPWYPPYPNTTITWGGTAVNPTGEVRVYYRDGKIFDAGGVEIQGSYTA